MRMWFKPSTGSDPSNGEDITGDTDGLPIVADRSWKTVRTPDRQSLLMGLHDTVWEGPQLEAVCQKNRWRNWSPNTAHKGPAPDLACACGIYGTRPDEQLSLWWGAMWGSIIVTAQVQLWGRVIICQNGYRAQHARIMSPVTVRMTCTVPTSPTDRCWFPAVLVGAADGMDSPTVYRGWCGEGEHLPSREAPKTVPSSFWLDRNIPSLEQRYDTDLIVMEV